MHQALHGEPLYWTILVVAQAVIVRREEVTGQGVVRHLHFQLLVYHAVPRRQIAMQQSLLVQELHGMHYLQRHRHYLLSGQNARHALSTQLARLQKPTATLRH